MPLDQRVNRAVVIIWPDVALAEDLKAALATARIAAQVELYRDYPSAEQLGERLRSGPQPVDAIVIGLEAPSKALRLLQQVSESYPETLAAAADGSYRSESVLAAMRAGASEYLAPPFDVAHLAESIRHRQEASLAEQPKGRLVCFVPAGGGNGASTVALHAANAMSGSLGKKVLLVDFDFQSGTIAFRLGLKPEFTLVDAAMRADTLAELWERLSCQRNGFQVLAAPPSFRDMPSESLRRLPEVFHSAVRAYPWILVDLPPGTFSACEMVLLLADAVYLICTPEVMSLHLARRRLEQFLEMGIPREKIQLVVNRVDAEHSLGLQQIETAVGLPVTCALSNDYEAVNAAILKGELIDMESGLGIELYNLGCRIVGVEPRPTSSSGGWRKILPFRKAN